MIDRKENGGNTASWVIITVLTALLSAAIGVAGASLYADNQCSSALSEAKTAQSSADQNSVKIDNIREDIKSVQDVIDKNFREQQRWNEDMYKVLLEIKNGRK